MLDLSQNRTQGGRLSVIFEYNGITKKWNKSFLPDELPITLYGARAIHGATIKDGDGQIIIGGDITTQKYKHAISRKNHDKWEDEEIK